MDDLENHPLLKCYVTELLKWNKSVNLIGRNTEKAVWDVHIRDSLQILSYIKESRYKTVVDIGTGSGLPGIPLSIFTPEKKFYLTDLNTKRIAFLDFITKKLKLNAVVIDMNKEFLLEQNSIVICRAFSSVKNILKWAKEHIHFPKVYYLLKGREDNTQAEIEEARLKNYTLQPMERGSLLIIDRSQQKAAPDEE